MKEVEQIEAVSSPAPGRGGGHDGVLRMDDRRRCRVHTGDDGALPVGAGDRGNLYGYKEDTGK